MLRYEIFNSSNRLQISTEHELAQFYILEKELLKYGENCFSFKGAYFPLMVEKMRELNPVKFYAKCEDFVQIRDTEDLLEANKFVLENMDARKWLMNMEGYKIVGSNNGRSLVAEDFESNKIKIFKSSLGPGCSAAEKVKISNSLIMGNSRIGRNVKILDSIIGFGVEILENSVIKKCVVASGYVFKGAVKLEGENLNVEL